MKYSKKFKRSLTKQKKEMANILEHYSQNSSISVDQSKEQLKELGIKFAEKKTKK